MTEEILKIILSETGVLGAMFIATLFFMLKTIRWGIKNYLTIIKDHNTEFLKSFNKMIEANNGVSQSIMDCSVNNSEEHRKLMNLIEEKHNKNEKEHMQLANAIKETNDSIEITHNSVKELHEQIKNYHN